MRGQVPALRNTNPAVPLALPYGLGELNRKKPVVVDAALAPAWVDVITALSLSLAQAPTQSAASAGPGAAAAAAGGAMDQARALSGLLARALSPPGVDAAAPAATPESTPCAAAALKGRAADDDGAGPPGAVPDGTPYPALARYFFLPPGQVRALQHAPSLPLLALPLSPDTAFAPCGRPAPRPRPWGPRAG